MNKLLSREQQVNIDFANAMAPMREFVSQAGIPSGLRIHDNIVKAISSFGTCELFTRYAERLTALELSPQTTKEALERGGQYQDSGFALLTQARAELKNLSQEITKAIKKGGFGKNASKYTDIIEAEFRRSLSELEIKASDVVKIKDIGKKAFDVLRTGKPDALIGYYEESIKQLEEARHRDDRGTSDNIPWWKQAAVAVAYGGAILGILICWSSGGNPYTCGVYAAIYLIVLLAAFIVNSFC